MDSFPLTDADATTNCHTAATTATHYTRTVFRFGDDDDEADCDDENLFDG